MQNGWQDRKQDFGGKSGVGNATIWVLNGAKTREHLFRHGGTTAKLICMRSMLTYPRKDPGRHFALWLALFWAFSYLLLSVRAQLISSAASAWISELRIISITAGALLFGLALLSARTLSARPGRPALLAANVLGASLTLLLLRFVIAPGEGDAASAVVEHARWVLVWAGYYGFWLAAFLAFGDRHLRSEKSRTTAPNPPGPLNEQKVTKVETQISNDWASVVTMIANEYGVPHDEAALTLITALRSCTSYEVADPYVAMVSDADGHAALLNRVANHLQAGLDRPLSH